MQQKPESDSGSAGKKAGKKPEPAKEKSPAGKAEQKESYEELEKKLAEAEKNAAEYLDLARRKQAEFENYRKRTEKENEEYRKYAVSGLVSDLLNVADDLGRALDSAKEDSPLKEGVQGIRDNLMKILAAQGLEEIPTDGKFDPNLHEALMVTEGPEDDRIAQVYQKGYTMNGKVLRYAKVIVTKKKEEPAPEKAPEQAEEPAPGQQPEQAEEAGPEETQPGE